MNTKTTLLVLAVWVILAGICFGIYQFFFSAFPVAPFIQDHIAALSSVANEYNSGNLDQAIRDGEKMTTASSTNVEAYLVLAASYAEKGNASFEEKTYGERAIQIAGKALAVDPNNSPAYNVIGYAHEIMGHYDEAIANYDKAIALDPKNAQAYSNKGHAYDLQGDFKTATTLYNKALSIDPNNDHALLNSARMDLTKNDTVTAKSKLNLLVKTSSNARTKAAAYQIMAFMEGQSETGNIDEGIKMLKMAVALDPSLPQAYVSLADLYLKNILNSESESDYANDISAAKAALKKALAINPNQASAYYELSQIAFIEGDFKLQESYKQKALEAIPKDITLGEVQKESLKEALSIEISNIKVTSLPVEE